MLSIASVNGSLSGVRASNVLLDEFSLAGSWFLIGFGLGSHNLVKQSPMKSGLAVSRVNISGILR